MLNLKSPAVTSVLRLILLGMTIASMVSVLIPVAEVMASNPQVVEDVEFSKYFTPSTIGPGSTTTLSFSIVNPDPVALTTLTFTDTLPLGVFIASPANAMATCDSVLNAPDGGTTINFIADRLGENSSCIITVDVTSSVVGVHNNISGQLTSDAGEHGNATGDLAVVNTLPGFSKNFEPSSISVGGRSTLTFMIDNNANAASSSNLDFTDNLPVGMVIADPANASTNCGTATVPPTLSAVPGTSIITLDANGTVSFPAIDEGATCTVIVDVQATAVGRLENISGDLLSEFESSGKASAVLTVTVDPLHLSKAFTDDPVPPGGTTTLEFTITNYNRSEAASGITFSDDLESTLAGLAPSGGLPESPCGANSAFSFGNGVLTLTNGELPSEGTCTFSVALQVPAGVTPGAYPNTTSAITGTVGSIITGTFASDTLFVEPAPFLAKSFSGDPVSPGEDVTLVFTITNTSTTSSATNIKFIDELTDSGSSTGFVLPFPVTVGLPPNPDPPCGNGSTLALISTGTDRQGLELTGGNLAAGATCTFNVIITIPATMPPGQYTNITETIYGTVDGVTYTGNPATDDLTIVAAPQLTKAFTDDPVVPGGTVTLEFTLSHHENSPGDATAINFTDNLSFLAGLTATDLPKSVCGGTLSGTTNLSFVSGTLAAGETCTFTTTLLVPAAAPIGDHTNTTSSVSATVSGAQVTAAAASDDLSIYALTFSKEFIDDPIIPGGTATLRFTLENSSSVDDASDIYFTDDLNAVLPGTSDLVILSPLPSNHCGGILEETSPGSLQFSGGSLAANEACSFDVTIEIPVGTPSGSYQNITSNLTAFLGGSFFNFDPAVDILRISSDWLLFSKSFTDDPTPPGGTVTLEFTISNSHPISTVTDIAFADDLDLTLAGLTPSLPPTPDPACGAGSSLSFAGGVLSLANGNLGPGDGCTFSVILDVPAGAAFGDYANTTSDVTGLINGLNVEGAAAHDDLRVSYMSFDKAFDGLAVAGGTVTLTFTIANPDPVNSAQRIAFSDDLDAVISGLTTVNLPSDGFCGPSSQLVELDALYLVDGYLDPDSSCTFNVTLQIPAGTTPGSYLNTTSDLTVDGNNRSHPATASLFIDPFVTINDVSVDEHAGTADFTVSLNGVAARDVEVNFTTGDDTALAGLDYSSTSGTSIIPTGDITKTLSIPILDDSLDENAETFTLTLSSPVNAAVLDGIGMGTIIDNDDPPTLSVNDVTVDEGAGLATFTVSLSAMSGLDVSVNYKTIDITAMAGSDYTGLLTTTLDLPSGTISKTVSVTILEDVQKEIDETFSMILSSSVNATITDGEGLGTILDNEFSLYLPLILKTFFGEKVVYENDFEAGIGDEWSASVIDFAPNGESFLGQFATDAITLTLTDLPYHSKVRISFDLYVIRSWDGNEPTSGPDVWEFILDKASLIRTTFSNWDDGNQAYPGTYPGGDFPARTGATIYNNLGYFWQGLPQDATYHFTFEKDHSDSDLEAVFNTALQVIADESWGLDNVEIGLLP